MSYTAEQKKKLKKLLITKAPQEASLSMVIDMVQELADSVPQQIEENLLPHSKNTIVIKEILEDMPNVIDESIRKSEAVMKGEIGKVKISSDKEVEKNGSALKKLFNLIDKHGNTLEEHDTKITLVKEDIVLLKKEIKDLWWSRKPQGSVGGGTVFFSGLNDVGLISPTNGQTLVYNSTTKKWENRTVSSSGLTIYTQTPSGAVNGSNKTYSVTNTIVGIFSFAINGQYLHPGTDYNFSGSTITFVNALPAELNGLPFTIVYY